MYRPSTRYILASFIALLLGLNPSFLSGQEIQQITTGESEYFDFNYEQFFTFDGTGYYSSYINDRISVFELDTKELVYETSFDLCEMGIAQWLIEDQLVIYMGYSGIIVEHIFDGTSETYPYQVIIPDEEGSSIQASADNSFLHINIFPGPIRIQFDLDRRHFLSDVITNLVFTTNEFLYYITGSGDDKHFIKQERSTFEKDTLLSNFGIKFGSFVNIKDKYFLMSEDHPIMVVDIDDNISIYDFEYTNIRSGIETSTGRLILAESLTDGTILYEIDIETSTLVNRDTIFSDRHIEILDSYEDRLYVEFNSFFEDSYGYMDYPYAQVEIIADDLENFHDSYFSSSQELIVIETNTYDYNRNITLIEKATEEIWEFQFPISFLIHDDEFEVLDTDDGIRLMVSEEEGKSIYNYDENSNSVSKITTIDNERGLGTSIHNNGENYLIATQHSIHTGFEYIHPETKEVTFHQVDGVIHGSIIPYAEKFFYVRNQNYEGVDEDFYLDYVMFDPFSGEVSIIEEKFFYPSILNSFPNINFTKINFGFQSIFNTSIMFDLRNQESIHPDQTTKTLLENIYFESDNYFFTTTGSPDFFHYKMEKSDFGQREFVFGDDHDRIIVIDDNSFVSVSFDYINYITEDNITSIDPPPSFQPNYFGLVGNKLLMQGGELNHTVFKIYNLDTGLEIEGEVEGFAAEIIGDHLISIWPFQPPYKIASTHLETGEQYEAPLNTFYSRMYSTDTSLYIHDNLLNEIKVFNPQLEEVESIDAEILNNSRFNIISEPGILPIALQVNRPGSNYYFRDIPDLSLVLFDPRTNSFVEYFDCESDLRFNKAFNIGPTSTVLLRTEDEGYQLHEVVLPEYNTVTTDDPIQKVENILISPNPTDRYITIDSEYIEATLFNSVGITVDYFENEREIDLENFRSGIYYLKISSPDGIETISKIIKH